MRTTVLHRPISRFAGFADPVLMLVFGVMLLAFSRGQVTAETKAKPAEQTAAAVVDPFGPIEREADPFETLSNSPVDAAAYVPQKNRWDGQQVDFQTPALPAPQQNAADAAMQPNAAGQPVGELPQGNAAQSPAGRVWPKDPCAAATFKPINTLGIGIAQPAGQMPTDFAGPCWDDINGKASGSRCWSMLCYQWDATSLCYRPLYFEQINAERYGYSCSCCCGGCCTNQLQSACAAAHFFGTIPALPYLIGADCPGECKYTLGYYRPGDCVPWRCHRPPVDPVAALTAGGIYTGLVFAIP